MKASVILPYYKNLNELKLTLNSLNKQINNLFEVVIVNDGSMNIEDELYNYTFPLQYHQLQDNMGRSFARNYGAAKAKYELLIFLDSDQVVKTNFIEEHISKFEKLGSSNILQFGLRRKLLSPVMTINNISISNTKPDSRNIIFEKYNWSSLNGLWHLIFSHNISISKKDFERIKGFDSGFKGWGLEDSEFAYRAKQNFIRFIYNNEIETYSLYTTSKVTDEEKLQEWIKNLNYFCSKYPNSFQVYMQNIFIMYFDSKKRIELIKRGITNPWVYCYELFEESLKLKKMDIIYG